MIKTSSITAACCMLAAATFAQEPTVVGRTEVTTQTTTSVEPLILRLGQIQVKDVSGQQVGTLEDIVVSPQGCIDMGVLSLGGTRLVPVPWQVIRTEQATIAGGAAPMAVTLQVDRTRLVQAPAIDRAQLRTQLSQAAFTQQINSFYGVQARGDLNVTDPTATASTNLFGARTNIFSTRTNMFPTGRTNFPPGRNLGRPEGLPPGQTPGVTPGRADPGFNNPPGTSPALPGTPSTTPGVNDPNRSTTPGVSDPNRPSTTPGAPSSPSSPSSPRSPSSPGSTP